MFVLSLFLGKVDPTVFSYDTDDYKCTPDQIIVGYDNIIQSDIAAYGSKRNNAIFVKTKSKVIAEQIFIHQNKTFAQQYFKKGVWGTDLTGGTSASSSSTDFVSFDNDNSNPIKFISRLHYCDEEGLQVENLINLDWVSVYLMH